MMNQPWKLLSVSALVLLTLCDCYADKDDRTVIPLELVSFTWTDSDSIRVCFSRPDDMDFKVAEMTYTGSLPDTEVSVSSSAEPFETETLVCADFSLAVDTLDVSSVQTYAIAAWNADGTIGTGIKSFALRIGPDDITVEAPVNSTLVRISGVSSVLLTKDINCINGLDLDTCYTDSPVTGDVCISVLSSDGFMTVCDATRQPIVVQEITEVSNVYLSYMDSNIQIETGSPENIDAFVKIQGSDYIECSDNICGLPDFKPSTNTYEVNVMEISPDSGLVVSSKTIQVLDLQVSTLQVSPDTIQVSFSQGYEQTFVTLTPPLSSSYSGAEGLCQDGNCISFFKNLDVTSWDDYRVFVTKTNDPDAAKVVTDLESYNNNFDEETVFVSDISHHTEVRDYHSSVSEVCLTMSTEVNGSVFILFLDSEGNWLSQTSDNPAVCPALEDVFVSLEESDFVRVLALVTSEDGGLYSSQLDLILLKPTYDQVGIESCKVSWQRTYGGTYMTEQKTEIECPVSADSCVFYLRAPDSGTESNYTLVENSAIIQSTTMKMELDETLGAIEVLTPFQTNYDGNLLVCFTSEFNSATYELGIETENALVSSSEDVAIVYDNGQTCALSSTQVTLGAYVNIWAVVVGYDESGNLQQAGEAEEKQIYLLANANVQVLILDISDTTINLQVTWQLITDTTDLSAYDVRLVSETGSVADQKSESINRYFTSFDKVSEGLYTVCVAVEAQDARSSDVCSDNVDVRYNEEVDPGDSSFEYVTELETVNNEVQISWVIQDEDVSSVLIYWTQNNTASQPLARKSKHLFEAILPLASHLKRSRRGVEWTAVGDEGDGFVMIPAGESSVVIGIPPGTWDTCLAPVVDNRNGNQQCKTIVITSEPTSLDPPTNLQFDYLSSMLSWNPPSGSAPYTYYVQWSSDTEKSYFITPDTEVDASKIIPYGEWTVEVMTILDNVVSDPSEQIFITIDGLSIYPRQSANREISFSWSLPTRNGKPSKYDVSAHQGALLLNYTFEYSCTEDCSQLYSNVQVDEKENFTLTVRYVGENAMDDKIQNQRFYFIDIPPIEYLEFEIVNATSVLVSWKCNYDADKYIINFYDDQTFLKFSAVEYLPCQYFYTADGAVANYSADVQLCIKDRCGDRTFLDFTKTIEGPPEDDGPEAWVIAVSSVLGFLVIMLIVIGIMYFVRKDKKPKDVSEGVDNDSGELENSEETSPATQSETAPQAPKVEVLQSPPIIPPIQQREPQQLQRLPSSYLPRNDYPGQQYGFSPQPRPRSYDPRPMNPSANQNPPRGLSRSSRYPENPYDLSRYDSMTPASPIPHRIPRLSTSPTPVNRPSSSRYFSSYSENLI